ncbi:hypothetical protein [Pedobacter sp. NJ-S-72]
MKAYLHSFIKANYRTIFTVALLVLIFKVSVKQNFLLFHTIVELSSIVCYCICCFHSYLEYQEDA